MQKTSQNLIDDFYRGQLRRMHRLVIAMVILFMVMISFLVWLKIDQNRSNKRLGDVISTLQKFVEVESSNQDKTNAEIRNSHSQLFKAMSCLLILHDSHAITDPTISIEECQKTASEINTMSHNAPQTSSPAAPTAQSAPVIIRTGQTPPPAPTAPQENIVQRAGGSIMNTVKAVTNFVKNLL
jgi:hypothetical protein